jgi:Holliday junction resolvase-like predicted endonuclease
VNEAEYVFVEVKTRNYQTDGNLGESITEDKKEHMINSAMHYNQAKFQSQVNWRIDVITVEVLQNDYVRVTHYENALFE